MPSSTRLTRDRILDAARRAVDDHGYERLVLRALARDLGVTAPALYDHFDSKDALLRAVAAQGFRTLEAVAHVDRPRAVDRLREAAFAYVAFAVEHPELFRLMFLFRPDAIELVDVDGVEVDNELGAASDAFNRGTSDVEAAIADGDLAPRDVGEIMMIMWATTHGVATLALTAPTVAAAVIEDVVDTVLAGLAP